ncbi:MAG: hypothetical protein BJ554DRAFT_3860 [Olpidium bornovanus]|uniref:Uncharacterized protein n=1 Tax=Olpidium bornovanus TaxID=278681 RepID=A0A8H7ZNK0_9FUNG|nr:MAG: hypothetical protein BJ554DRAFT_3860 [Olpidium bornovanus]
MYVVSKKFDGNITILPKSSVGDFVHILTDPTEERLANYIARGERNTWPKIHMIRNRMLPERTIIRGMLKARKEMRGMRAAASAASSLESLSPGSLAEDASKVPGLPPARTAHTPFARDEAEVPAQHPTNEEQNEIERERRAGKRELLARAGAATPPAAPAAAIDSAVSSSVSSLDRSFASATSPDSDVEDGSLAFLETPRDAFQAPAEEAQHWTTDSEGDEEDEVDPERPERAPVPVTRS